MKPYYEHGGIQIYLGDCREVLPLLCNADLILTDPPYGIGISRVSSIGQSRGKSRSHDWPATDWDDTRPSGELLQMVICSGMRAIIWGGNYFADMLAPQSCWLVWDKKLKNGWRDTFADCEMAWTNLGGPTRAFRHLWMGACRESETTLGSSKQHPTQKPVELMQWCIQQYASWNIAQSILDPFMGSGTTLLAAKNLGKSAIGIEIEEKYCEIAAKRLSQEVFDFK